jgi:acyl carrier protein
MEIKDEIRRYVLDNFLPAGGNGFDDATPLITGGVIDSIGMIGLVNFIEGRYGIEFLPREVDIHHLDTVARIEQIVLQKRSATGA